MNKEEALSWASTAFNKLSDEYQAIADNWKHRKEEELSKQYESDIDKMIEVYDYIKENLK